MGRCRDVLGSCRFAPDRAQAACRTGAALRRSHQRPWKIARRGNVAAEPLREALAALDNVAVPRTMKQLMPAALRLACDLDHPVYDCTYLALAIHEERPVVTADRRFRDVVRRHPYLAQRVVHLDELG